MGLLVRGGGADTLEPVLGLFPMLGERLRQRAGTLSGGQQQMLATARALCARPEFLLLDEPGEGLMPTLVEMIGDKLKELRETGLTMLLVETNLDVAFKVAQRVYVMEKGLIKFSGTKTDLLGNHEIQQRYLGVSV